MSSFGFWLDNKFLYVHISSCPVPIEMKEINSCRFAVRVRIEVICFTLCRNESESFHLLDTCEMASTWFSLFWEYLFNKLG